MTKPSKCSINREFLKWGTLQDEWNIQVYWPYFGFTNKAGHRDALIKLDTGLRFSQSESGFCFAGLLFGFGFGVDWMKPSKLPKAAVRPRVPNITE